MSLASFVPPHIPRCQHLHLNGVRCGSPALRGKLHCYYHSVLRQKRETITIPALDDALAVQLSLRQIMQAIASGQWDPRRCALMLYALQIAASNLRRVDLELRRASFASLHEIPPAPQKPASNPKPAKLKTGRRKSPLRKPPLSETASAQQRSAHGSNVASQLSAAPAGARGESEVASAKISNGNPSFAR